MRKYDIRALNVCGRTYIHTYVCRTKQPASSHTLSKSQHLQCRSSIGSTLAFSVASSMPTSKFVCMLRGGEQPITQSGSAHHFQRAERETFGFRNVARVARWELLYSRQAVPATYASERT